MLASRAELWSAAGGGPLIDLSLQCQRETISLSGEANNAILTKI